MVPDFGPVYAAGLFPRFWASISAPTYPVLDPDAGLTPGNMDPYMMNTGARAEIGLRAWWDAQYLVQKTPALRATVIGNGNASGYWTFALCEPDGLTIVRLDRYPGFWFDGRGMVNLPIPREPSGALRGQRPT